MTSPYIGVYKALYDYDANTEEELSIATDDLLYLIQKSDIDDWWTVKKRLLLTDGVDAEEPTGLIPANYIEPAPVVGRCEALYDYTKQTDEEISFNEGDSFELYDLADPDWLLAGNGHVYGFVPSNYVRLLSGDAIGVPGAAPIQPTPQPTPVAAVTPRPIADFAPPPVHKDRVVQQQQQQDAQAPAPTPAPAPAPAQYLDVDGHSDDESSRQPHGQSYGRPQTNDYPKPASDDEAPPPMPTRPSGGSSRPSPSAVPEQRTRATSGASSYEQETNVESSNDQQEQHGYDGEYFRWYIDEVDGRKKRPIVLAIGNGLIIIKPKTTNPKKLKLKSASSLDNNWRIRDLTNYNHEKKHVFLELRNPETSVELHAGSKDVAEAIISVLGDLKGADNAAGLKEVARAASTKTSASNRRVGRILYDFKAEGSDELSCRENDEVYVVDSTKSKEWWLCERITDGRQGVIPSSYIEIVATTNLDKLTDGVQRRKSQRTSNTSSSKGKVVSPSPKSHKHSYRSRDDREKIRESDKKKREAVDTNEGENMPNFHRVRTWIDSSGTFKVEAEFLGCMEGKIHLHKTNGVKIAVSASKLSIEDLEYVEKVTGTSLQKYKDEVAKQMAKRDRSKSAQVGSKSTHVESRSAHVEPVSTYNESRSTHVESKPAVAEPIAPPPPEPKPATVSAQDTPSRTPSRSATAAINDVPPQKPERSKASSMIPQSEPDYDWFDFFLSCGVDIGNCQRYSINFSKEQMDESILEDITPSLLRSLGLREGDILRVMKHLDNKFDRKKAVAAETSAPGGLFTEPTGALKNNSTTELSKVNASALPTPSPMKESSSFVQKDQALQSKIEDDAWAVKPAARSTEDLSKSAPRPQYTGSLQDLVDVKPLESNKTSLEGPNSATVVTATPSAPPMTPVKTGTLIQPNQQFSVQKTGSSSSNVAPIPATRTGGLVPIPTGGLIPMPTGFIPIATQPTGFVPIQATGGLVGQPTFGFVPLQTGTSIFAPQKTGPPATTFGQIPLQPTASFVPLQPGNLTQPQGMPLTSFGQQPTGGQAFGSTSNGLGGQPTGQLFQNSFVPQSTFGRQITGGFMGSNQTGGAQGAPKTTFGNQPTGGMMPQTSFGNQITGGIPPITSFGNQATGGMMPSTSFGSQFTGGLNQQPFGQQSNTGVNQVTNMFQNTSLGSQPTQPFAQQPTASFAQQPVFGPQPTSSFGQQPTTSFAQQPFGQQPTTSFGQQPFAQQPTTSFGQQPFAQQPTASFGQQSFGQQSFGQQPTTSFGQQPFAQQAYGQQPVPSFGQNSFEGFNPQPLQSQPTGLGFGNGPALQSQATGRRANLQAATADNPFGF